MAGALLDSPDPFGALFNHSTARDLPVTHTHTHTRTITAAGSLLWFSRGPPSAGPLAWPLHVTRVSCQRNIRGAMQIRRRH